MSGRKVKLADLVSVCEQFNADHPVGTLVTYWTGMREGQGKASRTRSEASVLGGHTAVVWVEGHSACIALSHVEPDVLLELP